jgi:hypothetical protein
MISARKLLITSLATVLLSGFLNAQQSVSLPSTVVPRLVNFSGRAVDAQGKTIIGIAGVTFAIYADQSGGTPLWMETQNVQADTKGNYIVQLGATKPEGLPLDLFTSGAARWLGVTINGGEEQPRILLLSVPYALKAADAETVGGLPASAFVLANKSQGNAAAAQPAFTTNTTRNTVPPPANPAVTGKGVASFLPMWDSGSDIIDSALFQLNSQIGIHTTTPAATLDVNGKGDVRDTLTLFPKGTDPTLAINGTTFKVDQTGKVTFVAGQTFPGVGTITGIAGGKDLTGGGTNGKITLNLDTTKVPQLNSVNTFTGNQGVIGDVTVTGRVGIGTNTPAQALDINNGNMVVRVDPGNDTTEADGGYSLVGRGAGGVPNTWWTLTAPVAGGFGVPANSYSIWQYPPNSVPGCCLNRFNILPAEASTDTGGAVTIDQNSNTQQPRTAGGMVKAMLLYSPFNGTKIVSCFNSTLSGAAATTPPCGFSIVASFVGDYILDLGFQIDDRFLSATNSMNNPEFVALTACTDISGCNNPGDLTPNRVEITSFDPGGFTYQDTKVYLIVY